MKKASVFSILVTLLIALSWSQRVIPSVAAESVKIPLSGSQVTQSSPVAADFDGDGYKEIVVGGPDGMLYVVAWDGNTWTTVWSRQVALDINAANPPEPHADNIIISSPAIGDLDNDGHLEIVVTVGGGAHNPDWSARRNGGVLVYRYTQQWHFSIAEQARYNPATGRCENRSGEQRGWPQPCIDQIGAGPGEGDPDGLWDGIQTTPALADLNGDGDLEIIVNSLDRRIHAWTHDGEVVSGWPISQWNGDDLWRGGISSPAVGDIDKDGESEVVVGTMSPYVNGQQDQNATLWAVNGDGSVVSGFPVQTEQHLHSSPALGDITGDGHLEIVVGVGRGIVGGRQNIVYAWRHDGTLLPNWPQETMNPMLASPALGDIDDDGQLEVAIGGGDCEASLTTDNYFYAWEANGDPLPGFSIKPPTPNYGTKSHPMCSSPVLADFDGDGSVEILIAPLGAWGLVTIETDGTAKARHTTSGALYSSPLVEDIDRDGFLEIIIAGEDFFRESKGAIWIWNEKGTVQSRRPWPMFHHNQQRTGLFPRLPILVTPERVSIFNQSGFSTEPSAPMRIQNAGSGRFEWELSPSVSAIQVAPVSGFLTDSAIVEITVKAEDFSHSWTKVGTISTSATVDGKAVEGSPSTTAVYLFTGEVSHIYLPLTLR